MVAPAPKPPLLALVDELLAEQQRLQTPVAGASRAYERGQADARAPRRFESLIPLTAPRAGEQYAFEVDLDSCTGCKACVSACHALNGLDASETWRDTGQLLGGCGSAAPVWQTITSACHHCADPGCLNGCPVLAYEKDPLTGIVRHLDDQCIGCQYCVLKCPYDVPKYNERLGIVRKCDLCHQRLAVGEAPACAQACPTQAIKIVVVTRAEAAAVAPGPKPAIAFPGPDPTYTRPTTRYVSEREFSTEARAADAAALRPQPAHWPLVLMLTFLPWAILLQATLAVRGGAPGGLQAPERWALIPLILGVLGLGAATFHLGQPLRAWRVFLGLRTSWFSREAVLFGGWFGATAALAATWWVPSFAFARAGLSWGAPALGLIGLVCSVMIYVDTRRHFWRGAFVAPRFFFGGMVLALGPMAPGVAAVVLALKLGVELASLRGESAAARLQRGPFRRVLVARGTLALLGLILLAFSPWLVLFPLVAGELAERYLFFRAVDAPKMPGYAVGACAP